MSSARATLVSRVEDYLLRVLRRIAPGLDKLMMVYVAGQSFESVEREVTKRVALGTLRIYRAFGGIEGRAVALYRSFTRALASIQASLEDIVSFSSSYMSLLFVVSMLAVVVTAWTLRLFPHP